MDKDTQKCFPARGSIKNSNQPEATTSSGQVIAKSMAPSGSNYRLGMREAPDCRNAHNAKLRGEVNDQTDFKQLLAYVWATKKKG